MAYITYYIRTFSHFLPSAVKIHSLRSGCDRPDDLFTVQRFRKHSFGSKSVNSGKDRTEIFSLVLSLKVHRRQYLHISVPKRRFCLVSKSQKRHYPYPVSTELRFRQICVQDLTFKHSVCLRVTFTDHCRHTRFDYTCLLKCDFRQSVSEHITMVKPDIGYYTHFGAYDIRAVKPASQACLDNSHINILPGKPVKSHHRSDLEKRKVKVFESPVPPADKIPDFFL